MRDHNQFTLKVYLVRDLKVFSSPDLKAWIIEAQLKEEFSFYCEESSSHSRRPDTQINLSAMFPHYFSHTYKTLYYNIKGRGLVQTGSKNLKSIEFFAV